MNWKPVTDEAVLSRMDAACRGHVLQADLKAQGITEYGKIQPDVWGGSATAENRPLEVFFQGKPMTLARWPNQGFAQITDAPKQTNGTFTYDAAKVGNRAERWAQSEDVWLHGYWMYDWADSYLPLKSVDAAQHTLTVPPPQDNYGIAKGKRFYVLERAVRTGLSRRMVSGSQNGRTLLLASRAHHTSKRRHGFHAGSAAAVAAKQRAASPS